MRTFLQRAGRYAPYATYGLTAGAVAGAPGSEYYSPVLDAVGNAFDLPGSSVRDLLVGRNPLDQFASPFSADNRVTGRDVLDHWGVTAPNKETGMAGWLDDPMEGLRDLAGFGVEILTDPLNVVSALKLGKLFRAGKKATTHNAALEALQRNPERQRLGREMVEAYGESGEHTMTLLDAATIAQKKDPNLVYGGVTAKRLEGAVAGIAATSAVADQLMESPLQQPAIPRPRLMQGEANDLFAGRIDQDQYNRLMDESGRAPVPRSEDHLTTLRDRMPPGFSNSPERIAAKGLDDLSPVVGMPVGARLDINEYARNNPVVTLHGKDGLNYARAVQLLPDETGKVSFGLVGGNKTNVKSPLEEYQFSAGPRGPAAVAAGEASKNSWAVVAGRVGALTSPDQVLSEIQAKMRDPQWRQVGYNPERHSYFYLSDDHRSRVVDADEVLQFGDFVLAKNPRTEMMSSEGVRDRLAAAGLNPGESDPRMLYQSPLDPQNTPMDDKNWVFVHGGSNWRDFDKSFLGSGEPSGVRPLGSGLYGYAARNDDELLRAISGAKVYANKYGGSDPQIHLFSVQPPVGHTSWVGQHDPDYIYTDIQKRIRDLYRYANSLPTGSERSAAFEEARRLNDANKVNYKLKAEMLPDQGDGLPGLIEAAVHDPSLLNRIGMAPANTPNEKIARLLAGLNPSESDPRMLYQSPLVRTQWNNVKHVTDELELRAGENPNFRKWDEGNVIRRHSDHYEHGVDSYAPYTVYHSTTNKDSYAPQGLGLPPEVKTHLMDKLSQLFSNDQDQIRYLSEHLQQTPSVAAEATDLSHMSISELRQLREGIENAGSNRFINQGFLPVTTPGPVNKVETAEQLLSALALANPLTYINAQAPFSEFKTLNPVSREIGSHFGTYSQAASINPNKVPQPFYIRADNVVDIPEDLGSWNAYKIATALRRQNPNIPIPSHQGLELPFSAEETSKLTRQERDYLSAALSQGQSVENLRASIRMMRLLKLNKIDALRYPNEIEGPGYSYVVFDPTNIKSAHNYGSYDRNNPNFYMQSPIESQLPRGATQFTPEGTTLMAFEPDPSTAPHEMAHYMRRRFMPGNPWTRDREEAFAGGFENFAATTSTSSPAMSAAFQYFNQEIPKVYDPQMGYRNLPARGGYDYADLLGVTETTSPLDPKQAPDLITPAGMALVRNLLSRFSQHGGI